MPEAHTLDVRPRRGTRRGEVLGEPRGSPRRMGRARQPIGKKWAAGLIEGKSFPLPKAKVVNEENELSPHKSHLRLKNSFK